jgi:uncharacterized protein (DUF433 family)
MQLILTDLPPDAVAKLEERARTLGVSTPEIAGRLLLQALGMTEPSPGDLETGGSSVSEPFEAWERRLVMRPEILGGEPVFPRSRLAVRHIGGMLERGVPRSEILEDYPYLTPSDLDFSLRFMRMAPRHESPGATPQAAGR